MSWSLWRIRRPPCRPRGSARRIRKSPCPASPWRGPPGRPAPPISRRPASPPNLICRLRYPRCPRSRRPSKISALSLSARTRPSRRVRPPSRPPAVDVRAHPGRPAPPCRPPSRCEIPPAPSRGRLRPAAARPPALRGSFRRGRMASGGPARQNAIKASRLCATTDSTPRGAGGPRAARRRQVANAICGPRPREGGGRIGRRAGAGAARDRGPQPAQSAPREHSESRADICGGPARRPGRRGPNIARRTGKRRVCGSPCACVMRGFARLGGTPRVAAAGRRHVRQPYGAPRKHPKSWPGRPPPEPAKI